MSMFKTIADRYAFVKQPDKHDPELLEVRPPIVTERMADSPAMRPTHLGVQSYPTSIRGSTPDNGTQVALARHSNAPEVTLEDMQGADVLVVCHASYVQALDNLSRNVQDRWSSLINWDHGQRRLVVVDETISNMVEEYRLELDFLVSSLGDIRQDVRDKFPGQMRLLNSAVSVHQDHPRESQADEGGR
jgi:hypothetical protein